jgi:hypothetical protein
MNCQGVAYNADETEKHNNQKFPLAADENFMNVASDKVNSQF